MAAMKTFVVRIWTPEEGARAPATPGDLRGIVCDASTGTETRFTTDTELLVAVRSFLADLQAGE